MEILQIIGSNFTGYIIPFLVVLTIIVFVHEMGHFLIARWCGVGVKVFSVGFGPEIVGRTDRHGTRWRISGIPLGGYVKFAGDENAASAPDHATIATMTQEERRSSFHLKPLWQRAAVVAAGPAANFVLAIAIFAAMFWVNGRPLIEARISEVETGSPAAIAGFEPGDLIVAINGSPIDTFGEVQRTVSGSADTPLEITIERDGDERTLTAVPERREITDSFGNTFSAGILGVRRIETSDVLPREYYSPVGALGAGTAETWFVVTRTLRGIADIVTGRESASQISGPIRIAKVSGDFYSIGIGALISLAALLSVSIGLINLFPIPMLDGGHLVFYAIEGALGRPLSERAQEIGFRIGLTLVLMLMIFATFNDVRALLT